MATRCCGALFFGSIILFPIIIIIILVIVDDLTTYHPGVKFYVDSASLTQFNLINRTTLRYNLTMVIGARNPNKRGGMCYNKIKVTAFYMGQGFKTVPLDSFCQARKNTTLIHLVFVGGSDVSLKDSEVTEYSLEKDQGLFNIDVEFDARTRTKVGHFKSIGDYPYIRCRMRLPIVSSNISAGLGFVGTDCDVRYPAP